MLNGLSGSGSVIFFLFIPDPRIDLPKTVIHGLFDWVSCDFRLSLSRSGKEGPVGKKLEEEIRQKTLVLCCCYLCDGRIYDPFFLLFFALPSMGTAGGSR